MASDVELRLAWHADRAGRRGLRDSLLTLAATGAAPGEAWAVRVRDRLVTDRPDHWLASITTIALAMADPRVASARGRLRSIHPPARIDRHLVRDEVAAGPYTGRRAPLSAILDDLIGPDPTKALARGAIPFPNAPAAHDLVAVHLAYLLAIALVSAVRESSPARRDGRAA